MFKIADIIKYIEISYLYVHKAAVFVLNPEVYNPWSQLPFWMFLQLDLPVGVVFWIFCVVGGFAPFPKSSC